MNLTGYSPERSIAFITLFYIHNQAAHCVMRKGPLLLFQKEEASIKVKSQHLQHHKAGEVLEGIVRNVTDLVKCQCHGL